MKATEKTLKDHFAGQAMQSILASEEMLTAANAISDIEKIELQEAIARLAYVQADYMMREKNRLEPQPDLSQINAILKG